MNRTVFELPFVLLVAISLGACSGGASSPRSSGAAGMGAGAGATGSAGTGAGGNATGVAGATSAAGSAGTTGAAGEATAGVAGSAGTPGAAGGAGAAGSSGAAGAAGMAGTSVDASVDTGASVRVFPSTKIVKMMVVGSSNEIGTCWRAFLWQDLHMAGIMNFDFVGQQSGGPNCGITAWNDTELQAMSGIIITGLPESTYLGWFNANPPDVILMHFGGADILAAKPVDGVMKAYDTALAAARMVNPNVILLIAQHTPEGKDDIITLNADIAKWAPLNSTAQSPVVAVDLYTGITAADESDGVHLNEQGSMKVALRWLAALEPFFKP